MHKFTDSNGREWSISVTVDTVRRVRDACKVDLSHLEAFRELGSDVVKLGDVLWEIVRPQAGTVTAEQFYGALGGAGLEAATEALTEEIIDFFGSRRGSALRQMKQKTDAAAEILLKRLDSKLDPEKLADEMERTSTPSAGNSPAASESIPVPTPSANSR